ncbi:glutathione S-transferase C-terminal domain-containing protein [Streptomyces sp. Je 1-79]|uniref:glutathione S-transferase C-terminal domain-containing protein n=1 Tax=Streptomyces sp. Je 1-79 TaxID=2943847 RepID=UPI0021A56DBF|nr:glutathione S-transferase C-terminal domain-containing protein [Streptomyces sp. Je 1-79]MCT4354036.1 glutathione S-transferase C-terminal domain-containing protein [Streptomyces sp. Je 1-79]
MSVTPHLGPYLPPRLGPAVPPATVTPAFRGRIGRDVRSGHYAVPHRYRLHLALACPGCLRIAVTHGLLGLRETVPLSFLPATPDTPGGGYAVLRPLYEASAHQYAGPADAPVLSDGWTGRIVSTHTPDILRDLARRFRGPDRPDLLPEGRDAETDAIGDLCERGINRAAQHAGELGLDDEAAHRGPLTVLFAALGALERTLERQPYILGDAVTAADIHLWVTLVQVDTVHRRHLDAAALDRIAAHPALWSYARRLAAHPAFGPHLDLDGIAERHRAHCAGREAAGAAMGIVDWAAYRG